MSTIKTDNLSAGYGGRAVVKGVNIEALKGQVVCLLGPNGSGKTTVLRTISGLLAPVEGTVYVSGRDISSLGRYELARNLAVMLTERVSPGLLTAFEVAAMGRHPYTGFLGRLSQEDIAKTRDTLKLVGADYIADRYFDELSDGEKQKVMLARALVQDPKLLVLDEPTTHLDVRHRVEIISILNRLTKEKGITVILSLHDVDLAIKSCDVVVLVKDGRILACGAPENVIQKDTIERLYDIRFAEYNELLGSIELPSCASPSVFVIGGGGTGARVYRLLAKHGCGFYTGVIHENDIDYHVGKSTGAAVIGEKPFEPITDETMKKAEKAVQQAKCVVDTGYPVGMLNRRNVQLVIKALRSGKIVFSLRDREESYRLFGDLSERIKHCGALSSIVEGISFYIKN